MLTATLLAAAVLGGPPSPPPSTAHWRLPHPGARVATIHHALTSERRFLEGATIHACIGARLELYRAVGVRPADLDYAVAAATCQGIG